MKSPWELVYFRQELWLRVPGYSNVKSGEEKEKMAKETEKEKSVS